MLLFYLNSCEHIFVGNLIYRILFQSMSQKSKKSTKKSAAQKEETLPVALIHQGINEVGITFGKVSCMDYLDYYFFSFCCNRNVAF